MEPVVLYKDHIGLKNIIIPDAYKYGPIDPPVWGWIRDMGPKCTYPIKKGDKVVFGKFAGARMKDGDKTWIFVREHEILAVQDES